MFPLSRPTLVLEIVLSCRLILAGESPDSKPKLQILPSFPWSDTSQTRRCTSPSSSIITENHGSSSHLIERERKLEPNRRLPWRQRSQLCTQIELFLKKRKSCISRINKFRYLYCIIIFVEQKARFRVNAFTRSLIPPHFCDSEKVRR